MSERVSLRPGLLVAFNLLEAFAEYWQIGGRLRIDDRHMVQTDLFRDGDTLDDFTVSDQHRNSYFFLVERVAGTHNSRIISVGEDNALRMALQLGKNRIDETHGCCNRHQA